MWNDFNLKEGLIGEESWGSERLPDQRIRLGECNQPTKHKNKRETFQTEDVSNEDQHITQRPNPYRDPLAIRPFTRPDPKPNDDACQALTNLDIKNKNAYLIRCLFSSRMEAPSSSGYLSSKPQKSLAQKGSLKSCARPLHALLRCSSGS